MRKTFLTFTLFFFAASLFAQTVEAPQAVKDQALQKKHQVMQTEKNVKKDKIGEVDTKLRAPKDYVRGVEAEEVYWTDDFEEEGTVSFFDFTDQGVYTDTSWLNPYEGDFAWWCGIINENWDYPMGYGDGWEQFLTKDADIDLTGNPTAASYKYYLQFQNEGDDFDYLLLQVSEDDGATWVTLEDYQGSSDGYQEYTTDLSAYSGSTLKLRWYFYSDGAYSSVDGNDFSDGAYYLDNSSIVIDGTETLFDDGGDSMIGFTATAKDPVGIYWEYTDSKAASGTHSYRTSMWPMGSSFAMITDPIDLTDVQSGMSLKLDFQILGQGLRETEASFGLEDYWVVEISPDGGNTYYDVDGYGWQGTDGDWWSYIEDIGVAYDVNVDVSEYAGETIQIRWRFHGNLVADTDDPDAGIWVDDPTILIGVDPNEPNNSPATATMADIPYFNSETLIAPAGDADFYMFYGEAGQWLNVIVSNVNVDTEVLLASAGSGAPDDPGFFLIPTGPGTFFADGVDMDQIMVELQYTGYYMMRVRATTDDEATGPFTGPYSIWIETPNPAPMVTKVEDVKNDQGLKVRLTFEQPEFVSNMVPAELTPAYYEIQRANLAIGESNDVVEQIQFGPKDTWQVVVPTLEDDKNTRFRVAAMYPTIGDRGEYYAGSFVAGKSEDNLTPEFLGSNATADGNEVTVDWNVDLTIHYDVLGYKIYRSTDAGFTPSSANLLATVGKDVNEYVDGSLTDNTYYYKVVASDDGGNEAESDEMMVSVTKVNSANEVPEEYGIDQNYPNPFNPTTTLSYALPYESNVTITVYNSLGQEVTRLVNTVQSAGYQQVVFNAANVSSGIYFYNIKASSIDGQNEFTATKKMMLLK